MSDDTTNDAHGPGDPGSEWRAVIVSAYVDGEATPDEVRQVESDAALMAEAARLRALKREVGDVPLLSSEHRDRLLADALARFDIQHRTAPPPASRSGGGRWLSVAAAVVAVVAAGGIAISLVTTSGSEDDSAPDANEAVQTSDEEELNDLAPADESAGDSVAESELTDAASAETTAGAEVGDAQLDQEESPGEPDDSGSGGAPTAGTSSDTSESPAQRDSAAEELPDDEAMVEWVLRVQDGELSPGGQGDTVCERAVLGTATHRRAVVVVAFEDERVVARDVETCDEVLSADAP